MKKTLATAALFAVAGLLSASAFVSYANWISSLYAAVPSQSTPSGLVTTQSFDNWYRANTSLTKYADRQWAILCLGFPVAITLAALVAWGIGWLRHLPLSLLVAGMAPIYLAPGLVFLLSAAIILMLLPALVLAAVLLTFSVKIITSKWSNTVLRRLLLTGVVALALWFLLLSAPDKNAEDRAWSFFILSLETTWAFIFGLALMAPRPFIPAENS